MYIHNIKYILLYKTIILYSYEHCCEMDIMILWGRESSDQMPNNCTEPCRHLVGGVHSKIDWYLPAFTPRAANTFQATPCNTEVAVKRRIGLLLTGSPVVKWNDWPTKWPAKWLGIFTLYSPVKIELTLVVRSIALNPLPENIQESKSTKILAPAVTVIIIAVAFHKMTMIVAAMNDMMRLAKAADMMRLAKAADMPSWVNVIGGIHRIRWIHWIPKRLLLGVRLRLIRDCWRRESTSARMHHWATLGVAVLQLAAANPGGTFTKETRLVYSAELVVLPSLQRQKATQTALCGIRNM